MTVSLTDAATGFRLRLDQKRAKFVTRELAHEKKVRPHHRGIDMKSDASCLISVRSPGRRERRYQIFDGTIVLEESTNLSWQFFAGLLLMDWLKQAQPAVPAPPFQPAVP